MISEQLRHPLSLFDNKGKVAIVTGASGAFGRGCAIALGALGGKLMLASGSRNELDSVAAEVREVGGEVATLARRPDSLDDANAMLDAALARFGRVDQLGVASGVNKPGCFQHLDDEARQAGGGRGSDRHGRLSALAGLRLLHRSDHVYRWRIYGRMSGTFHIGVVGGGLMGHGIAYLLAAAGHRVGIFEPSAEVRASLPQRLRGILDLLADDPALLDRISARERLAEAARSAQFVFEAAPEKLALKQRIFADLEAIVSSETILASNSSAIPSTEIGRNLTYRGRVVGTHFWNPPHL